VGEHRAVRGQLTGCADNHRVRPTSSAVATRCGPLLAADERLSRELDLAGLSAVLTEVSETPPR
jgi:hypothetical protein